MKTLTSSFQTFFLANIMKPSILEIETVSTKPLLVLKINYSQGCHAEPVKLFSFID
jgi:hypothetical protein